MGSYACGHNLLFNINVPQVRLWRCAENRMLQLHVYVTFGSHINRLQQQRDCLVADERTICLKCTGDQWNHNIRMLSILVLGATHLAEPRMVHAC